MARPKLYEDGTNVASGTKFCEENWRRVLPWYNPAEGKAPANWKDRWTKLRARFEKIIDDCCTLECVLIQRRIPASAPIHPEYPGILQGREIVRACNGLWIEPSNLFAPNGDQLIGLFSFNSVQGKPMLDKQGQPVAFRLGLTHQFVICPEIGWECGSRPLPMPQLLELARDGTNLVYQLPSEIACSLWRNLPSGFSRTQNAGDSLWFDTLFQLSLQQHPGSTLFTQRYDWFENGSVGLVGDGLFPSLPNFFASPPGTKAPHDGDYPMAYYARLPDVARASVAAIDEILERELGCVKSEVEKHAVEQFDVPLQSPIQINTNKSATVTKPVPASKRNRVFISYSHKDTKFLDELLLHLRPLERANLISKWSDKQIAPGSQWFDEIKDALVGANVAVMMVSPGFLASDFMHEHELGPLLKEAEQGGVRILWIPVRACSYKETPLKNYQAVISPDKPMAEMKAERDKAWVKVCQEIKRALNSPVGSSETANVTPLGQNLITQQEHRRKVITPLVTKELQPSPRPIGEAWGGLRGLLEQAYSTKIIKSIVGKANLTTTQIEYTGTYKGPYLNEADLLVKALADDARDRFVIGCIQEIVAFERAKADNLAKRGINSDAQTLKNLQHVLARFGHDLKAFELA